METLCPLIQKPCLRQECAWYAAGINVCGVVAVGMITEKIHDMSTEAYKMYVAQPTYEDEENAEDQNY